MSKFREWFEAQHGKRERGHHKGASDKDLSELIEAGKDAAFEMEKRWSWDNRWTSALWAWQASEPKEDKSHE